MAHEEWASQTLDKLATEITVGFVGPMVLEYRPAGIPLLRSQNIEPFRINNKDLRFISPDFHARIRKSRLRAGDVVIVRTGKPGVAAVVPEWLENANCSDLVIVRTADNLDSHFLAYYLNSVALHQIDCRVVGAVQQHFNVGSAKELVVVHPPVGEQRRIVEVLRCIDDKIELNLQMNQNLESVARALFRSWFVDFDPVVAKAEGRRQLGMCAHVATQFPQEFEQSELGVIPQGWTIENIGGVVSCVGGGTPSTAEPNFWERGTFHWATPKDFSALQSPILLETDRKITEAGVATISSGLLPVGTVLMSSRAPVGYLAITAIPVAINQGFIALKANKQASSWFLLNWCQVNMAEIESRATGTTFAEISKQTFRPIRMVLPPEPLMTGFTDVVRPLYARITNNLQQSRTLAALRDTLLPKLMSGELRVRDAEKLVDTHV